MPPLAARAVEAIGEPDQLAGGRPAVAPLAGAVLTAASPPSGSMIAAIARNAA